MAVAAALSDVETDERRVVAARDVGSHAWNVAGPESDRDVGLLFRQPPAAYATLDGYETAVERHVRTCPFDAPRPRPVAGSTHRPKTPGRLLRV